MADPIEDDRIGQAPIIVGVPVALAFIMLLLGLSQGDGLWRAFGTGLLVSAASGLVGAFFGFLFGMPRDLSRTGAPSDPAEEPSGTSSPASKADTGRVAWANNNLVEVSDWLTKIIVGIGLVEFKELVPWIGEISASAGDAAGFTSPGAQATFGASVILASFVYGFLLAYVYARTIIAVIFARAQSEVDEELRLKLRLAVSEKAELVTEKARLEEREAEGQRRFKAVIADLPDDVRGPSSVLAALYAAPPEGFNDAIAEARTLLANPAQAKNPRLHAYLAFGLGQAYRYRHERTAPAAELQDISDQALEALKRALSLDPGLKPWLRSLWSRKDPDFRPDEDDLTPFWDHSDQRPRFAALLE